MRIETFVKLGRPYWRLSADPAFRDAESRRESASRGTLIGGGAKHGNQDEDLRESYGARRS
jgi:hypothetical protein